MIQEKGQGLGADYANEKLYLLDDQERQVDTIQYIRGLENHPLRGEEPDIQNAIDLVRRTNTRLPPNTVSSSDESGQEADTEDSSSCHGFSTPSGTDEEDEADKEVPGPNIDEVKETDTAQIPDIAEEDRPDYERILAIIQGRLPPEPRPDTPPRRRSTTRDDLLDEEAPAEIQAGAPTHTPTTPPQPSTSSDETSPMRFLMRSGRVLTGAPTKKKRGPPEEG